MTGRRTGMLVAALLGAVVLVTSNAATALAAARPRPAVDFTGIVALDDCSGSLVKPAGARSEDPALVLSNGHCVETGPPAPGEIVLNQPSTRTFTLLDAAGQRSLGTLTADTVVYATMTGTDISLYRLTESYADIEQRYHSTALSLASAHPRRGESITIASGYWRQQYSCAVDGFVDRLAEAAWTWRDSLRYTAACSPTHGTSGSPIIDDTTHQVVGVNNTGNDNGERCTLNNPCEIDRNGVVTVRPGADYGEETLAINGCLGVGNTMDLAKPGCALAHALPAKR